MKHTFLKLVVVGVLMASVNVEADVVASPASASSDNAPLLFVQTAKTATLTADAKTPNAYTLTLNDVNPSVLWFTDRPGRAAGSVGIKKFVAAWGNTNDKDNFKVDHPNAALLSVSIEQDDSGKETAPVFTLSQPNYDAAQHRMTYHVVLVQGSDKPLKTRMKDVAVFVDANAGGRPTLW